MKATVFLRRGRGRKTDKIGAISDLRREKINDVYDRRTRYFSEKYGNGKHRPSKSTTSDYFTFKAGNTLITIRNGNHKGRNQRYRFVMEADLFNLVKEEGTPEENATKLGYSLKTIRRYCNSRGVETKRGVSDEYLMRLIDDKLSVRKNIEYLKEEHGICISKDRVSRVLHSLNRGDRI